MKKNVFLTESQIAEIEKDCPKRWDDYTTEDFIALEEEHANYDRNAFRQLPTECIKGLLSTIDKASKTYKVAQEELESRNKMPLSYNAYKELIIKYSYIKYPHKSKIEIEQASITEAIEHVNDFIKDLSIFLAEAKKYKDHDITSLFYTSQ